MIKQHPFFISIDWEKLSRRESDPPYKPIVAHDKDLQNFDKMFTDEKAEDTPSNPSDIQNTANRYDGFTYKDPSLI